MDPKKFELRLKIEQAAKNNTLVRTMLEENLVFADLFEVIDSFGNSPVHIITRNGFLPQFLYELDENGIYTEKKWFLTNFKSPSYYSFHSKTVLHEAAEIGDMPKLMKHLAKIGQPLILEDLKIKSGTGANFIEGIPIAQTVTVYNHLPSVMAAFRKQGTPILFEMLTGELSRGHSMLDLAAQNGVLSPIVEQLHREGHELEFENIKCYLDHINFKKHASEYETLCNPEFWERCKTITPSALKDHWEERDKARNRRREGLKKEIAWVKDMGQELEEKYRSWKEENRGFQ